MKRLFACVSTRTQLATMVIGLSFLCSIIYSMPASAAEFNLSYIGPASSNDRYNLTSHPKHPRVNLRIPVYFKYNPGTTGVTVKDVYRGKDPGNGARFNGYYYMSGDDDGHFDISNFHYDSSTGLWRTDITARLTEKYGQLAEENSGGAIYQFRLELDDHNGIIAYAKGWASQANKGYRVEYNGTWNGGFDEEELRMSLPCDITQDVELGPNQPNQLILFDLDQPRWDHPGTNRGKDIYVTIFDETDGTVAKHYHGPDHDCGEDDYQYHGPECMGENGTLSVRMTMKPGHKYRIKVWPNWVNNLIEYHLPFDNISYATECEPKVDMRTTVDFTKSVNKGRFKQLSSYGKYNSNEGKGNNNSIAEVMGYPGGYHFKKWEGISPQDSRYLPKAIMDSDKLQGHGGELYPGDVLTWWFRAYNSGGYIVPEEMKMDFTNLREGWIDSRPPGQSWNQPEPKPEGGSNWFRPADQGGPLNGSDHRQVMWGCYGWGEKCMDYKFNNSGFRFNSNYPDEGVFVTNQEAVEKHYRYIVKSGDAGQTLCQWLRMSWEYNGWKQRLTPKACVKIPYHYPPPPDDKDKHSGVVPTARVADGYKSKVQAGDDVQFSYSLTNTSGSGSTVSRQIEYRSYTFILRRGAKLPQNSEQKPYHYAKRWDGNGVGCGGRDIIPGTQGRCEQGVGGTSEKIYPGQTWPVLRQPKYNVSGIWLAQPGDKICSYIAIDNNWSVKNDQSADTFRASNIACVVVTKSPNLNLSGSDSYAKDGFTGSDVRENIVPGTDKRGSYSQYGLLTGDTKVTNFGSAGYTTAYDKYRSLACKLSYANTDNVQDNCNDLDGLKSAGLIKPDNGKLSKPKLPTSFKNQLQSQVSIDPLLTSGDYRRKGSLTITGGSLSKEQHVRLFVQGNVTISGNISIDEVNPIHKSLSDIPSLTVVATGDIQVEHGVSVIAGTYVAGGKFESCKDAQNQKKTPALGVNGVCQNKLKINGAIVSGNSPIFRRTFGAGNLQEDNQWETDRISSTAEWINYTPNLWLTTSNGSSGNKLEGLTTTQVTNLPVRY